MEDLFAEDEKAATSCLTQVMLRHKTFPTAKAKAQKYPDLHGFRTGKEPLAPANLKVLEEQQKWFIERRWLFYHADEGRSTGSEFEDFMDVCALGEKHWRWLLAWLAKQRDPATHGDPKHELSIAKAQVVPSDADKKITGYRKWLMTSRCDSEMLVSHPLSRWFVWCCCYVLTGHIYRGHEDCRWSLQLVAARPWRRS